MRPFYNLLFLFLLSACGEAESLKLTREDRLAIDGASNNEIVRISNEADVWCRDSSDVMVKKAVDSMIVARQNEISQAKVGQAGAPVMLPRPDTSKK